MKDQLIDNRYRILKVLGSGLSGEVLSVEDQSGKKALKFLKKIQFNVSKEDALQNFKNEFSILSELNHPGIARILDFGFDTQLQKYYFTTELIEGADFFGATENMCIEEIELLAIQSLRALTYLHSRGIYHLDIKPQNILVDLSSDKPKVKIIDFGLASFEESKKRVGTPAYMAPEIILGGGFDGRSDLYSFGVLLYKVFTRQNPFASKNVKEVFQRQQHLRVDKPSQVNSNVPSYWDEIILRLLEKNPTDRYTNGSSVIRDINFLANKSYEIETIDTRYSYIPEKGTLIARNKEVEIFNNLFDLIFKQEYTQASHLFVIEGREGRGKTRLLNEFKYHSQLNNIPVYDWHSYVGLSPDSPFCLQVDTTDGVSPDQINLVLQKHINDKILILWATQKAPIGWSDCEVVSLKNFSEEDLGRYIQTITGLQDAPKNLIKEIYKRTDGNPLFVVELIKNMLANNMLLDSSGRWASSTFEDIGIDFNKIQIPQTVSGLLLKTYENLNEEDQNILKWLSVINESLDLETLKKFSHIEHPQAALLNLTKSNLIYRSETDYRYFFTNIMMRDVVYRAIDNDTREKMHDRIANYFKENKKNQSYLYHLGSGSDKKLALDSLKTLGKMLLQNEENNRAVSIFEKAYKKSLQFEEDEKYEAERLLADSLIQARDYKQALIHYQHLKEIDDQKELNADLNDKILLYEKLGDLYVKLNDFDEAQKLFQAALEWLSQNKNNTIEIMIIENHLANIHMKSGRIEEAEEIFRRNYKVWNETFDDEEKLKVQNNWLADLLILKKSYNEALDLIQKDINFFEKSRNSYLTSRAYYVKGDLLFKILLNSKAENKNQIKQKALEAFESCLKISKEIDSHEMLLRVYNGLGNLYYFEKDYQKTVDHYERALALARKREEFGTAATISLNIGNIFKIDKKYRDAYAYLIYAVNTLGDLENKNAFNWMHLLSSYVELAEAYRELKELDKAEEAIQKAEQILEKHDHLSSYEFWIWLEKSKIAHINNNKQEFEKALKFAEDFASQEVEIEELKKFKEQLSKKSRTLPSPTNFKLPWNVKTLKPNRDEGSNSELETILQVNKFLNSEHNPEHLLKIVLNYALEISGAESGLVLLMNEQSSLEVRASVNMDLDEDLTHISTSIAHHALQTGEIVISADALSDGRFDSSESVVLNELKSVLCVPLRSRNKVVGVLYLDNRCQTNAFEEVNYKLLYAYCDQVGIALENARLIYQLQEAKEKLKDQLEQTTGELEEVREKLKEGGATYQTKYSYSQIISRSKAMQEVFRILDKITETNLSVFISGASGTGKELIAKAIHYNHPQRKEKRFIAINCGAIPPNLIESELFGYKTGSFTGAVKDKKGLFEEADGGTIFLDEIGELETNLQVKLLRVLQENEITRIGDTQPIKVDVRVISASHKNLEELIEQKIFRQDLFYRLCQIKLSLPPLSHRKEDIPPLVTHFIEKFKKENQSKEKIKTSPQFMKALFNYDWPGNVRELENVIHVACALRQGPNLEVSSLPKEYSFVKNISSGPSSDKYLEEPVSEGKAGIQQDISSVYIDGKNKLDPSKTWYQYESLIIAKCFQHNSFKKGDTAHMLGISPSTLYKKIKESSLQNRNNKIYEEDFFYEEGKKIKEYIPEIFKAALSYQDNKPYAAIRQLGVSQGYFYKIIKQAS